MSFNKLSGMALFREEYDVQENDIQENDIQEKNINLKSILHCEDHKMTRNRLNALVFIFNTQKMLNLMEK